MTLPNFAVIGASKGGTSALYHWLREHPDVFMPPQLKETFFFCYEPGAPGDGAEGIEFPIKTLAEYEALFSTAGAAKAIGEATPLYLDNLYAAAKMRTLIPGARLIASLRNPVDRVFSHAQMNLRQGRATDLAAEVDRLAATDEHEYATKFTRWLAEFPRAQFCVVRYDDVESDPQAVVSEIFRFLDVDDSFTPDTSVVHNPGGLPRSKLAQRLIDLRVLRALRPLAPMALYKQVARLRQWNSREAELPADVRGQLAARYRDDILETQQLLGVDLSMWLAQ